MQYVQWYHDQFGFWQESLSLLDNKQTVPSDLRISQKLLYHAYFGVFSCGTCAIS